MTPALVVAEYTCSHYTLSETTVGADLHMADDDSFDSDFEHSWTRVSSSPLQHESLSLLPVYAAPVQRAVVVRMPPPDVGSPPGPRPPQPLSGLVSLLIAVSPERHQNVVNNEQVFRFIVCK